jgi:hypothetical protein
MVMAHGSEAMKISKPREKTTSHFGEVKSSLRSFIPSRCRLVLIGIRLRFREVNPKGHVPGQRRRRVPLSSDFDLAAKWNLKRGIFPDKNKPGKPTGEADKQSSLPVWMIRFVCS